MTSDDVAKPLDGISHLAFRAAASEVISIRALRRQCEQLLNAPEDLRAFLLSLWDTTRADSCPVRLLGDTICANCPESWRTLIMPPVEKLDGADGAVEFAGFATAVHALLKRIVENIARFEEMDEHTEGTAATRGLEGRVSERAVSILFHHRYHTLHMAWRSCLTRSRRSGQLGVVDRNGLRAGICAAANIPHNTRAVVDFCASVFPECRVDGMDYKTFCRRFTIATACQGVHRREGKAVKHFSLTNNALVLNPAAIGPGTVFARGKRNPEGRYTGEALLATLQDAATHLPREILVAALRRGLMVEIETRLAGARSRRFFTDTDGLTLHECTNDNADVLEDLLIEYTRYLAYAWDVENKPTNVASSSVITQVLAVVNRNGNREGVVDLIERTCQKEITADSTDRSSLKEKSSSLYTTSQLSSIWRTIDAYQRKCSTLLTYEDIPPTIVNKQLLWRRCLEREKHAPHRDAGRMPFMTNKSVFGMPSKSDRVSDRGHQLILSEPRAYRRGSTQLFKSSILLPEDILEQLATDRPTVYYAPVEKKKVAGPPVCVICKGENHDETWPHVVRETYSTTKCLLCEGYGHQSIACPLRSENRCTICLGRLELAVWYTRKPLDIEVIDNRVVAVKRHGYSHEIGVLVGYLVALPFKYPAWVDFDMCHLNADHPEVNHDIMRDSECSIPISAICWKLKNSQSLFLDSEQVLPWDSEIWKLDIQVKKIARKFRHQLTFLRDAKEFLALTRIDRRAQRLRCEYADSRYFKADLSIDADSNIVTDLRKNGLAKQRGVKKGMCAVVQCKRNSIGEPIGEITVEFEPTEGKAKDLDAERRASIPTDARPDFENFIATQVRTFGAKQMTAQGAFPVPGLPNTTQKYVLKYRDIRSLLEGYSKAKTMLPIVNKVNRFHQPTALGYRDLVLVTVGNVSIHFVPSIILSCWKHSQKEIEELADDATILLNKERGNHFFEELLMARMDERLGMCQVCEGVGHWQGNCPSVPRVDFRPLLNIHEELEVAALWS